MEETGGPGKSEEAGKQEKRPSSTGIEPRVAGVLAYLFWWVSGLVLYLMEKDNRFIRFHALQSIFFSVAMFGAYLVLIFIFGIISLVPGLGLFFLLFSPIIFGVLWLGGVALWIVLMVKAYQEEKFKLPIIGDYAERYE